MPGKPGTNLTFRGIKNLDAAVAFALSKGMSDATELVRLVPLRTRLYLEKGTKRVLEYSRLAMGFANVRASRYGIR